MGEIWDCFFFNDEFDLLTLRLRALDGAVDRFLLVEGDHTFTGLAKPLHFARRRRELEPWADRIVHVPVELTTASRFAWHLESEQRRAMRAAVVAAVEAHDIDRLLVGDVDELWDPAALQRLPPSGPAVLQMQHANYFGNYRLPMPWRTSTLAFRPDDLGHPRLESFFGDLELYWEDHPVPELADAGLHLSFPAGADRIRTKLASYAHQEMNNAIFAAYPFLERCVDAAVQFQGKGLLTVLARKQLDPWAETLASLDTGGLFNFSPLEVPLRERRALDALCWFRSKGLVPPALQARFDASTDPMLRAGAPLLAGLSAGLHQRRRRRDDRR